MNANAVNVAVVDGKTITESVELRTTQQGEPVRIKAVQNGKYILAEGTDKPVAPENITIKRVGNDLHVATEGSDPDQPQLIIEGFFSSQGQLVGVAEDGAYYEYISSDGDPDRAAAFLHDGASSPQVLGSDELLGFGDGLVAGSGLGWFWPALLGLGALGVLGAVVAHNRDDDKKNNDGSPVVQPGQPGIGGATDNVGSVQGPIDKGGSTDDRTPTFTGTGTPGNIIIIEDNGKPIGEVVIGDDGKWEFTPTTPLPEGEHSIIVIEKDKDGNVSEPSDEFDFIIDITAPGKSAIDSIVDDFGDQRGVIENNGHTDDNTPTLRGTAEAGAKLEIFANGDRIGETIVNADGTWSFTPSPALDDGEYSFTTVASDGSGNAGLPSDPYIVTIDTIAPVKPGIGTGGIELAIDNVGPITGDIGNGGSTDDGTPTFSGGGLKPGEKVTILDDGVPIGEVIVGEDGRWEFTPNPDLDNGAHPITVIVTDKAGNPSEPSDPYIVIVDIVAPVAPTIDRVWDDQGTATGPINPGDSTDDAQPEISGQAEPGSTVIIYDNGVEIGRESVGSDGRWSHIPVPPLLNGPHDLTAKAQDAVGNISDPSNNVDFDLMAGGLPPAPSITGVADDVADDVGNIMPGSSTNDTEPEVSGTAQPFSTVTLFVNGVPVGTNVADEFGNWRITPAPALTPGLNVLTATATNAAGNVSTPTGDYPIIVDIAPPAAADARLLEDNVGPVTDPITSGDTTDDNTPTYSGTAEPNTILIIYDDGREIDRVPVDASGNWTFTPAPPLGEGRHIFHTVVVDAAGNRSPESPPLEFFVDTSAVAISIEQALDNVGPIQDPLASGSVTDDATPTLSGQATPGGTVNVYLDGLLLQANVPVNAQGRWEYTVAPPLPGGSYAFSAAVVTPAGGESPRTADFNLEIDLTRPAAPTLDEIRDDVGDIQDPLVDGSSTDDTTPTLVGTGVPGETIIIRNNGLEIGREIVRTDRSWSFTPNPPLNNGTTNVFDVIAQDPAGNLSDPSPTWTITIDTDAPTTSAVVESMGKDSGADSGDFVTNDGSAGRLIQGSLTAALAADEKVQISTDGGATWLDVVVNVDGTWNFLDQNSHTGDWEIQTRVADESGNSNTSSQSVELDNQAPGAPSSVTRAGDQITVDITGGNAESGDRVNVVLGEYRFDYELTDADILNGQANFTIPDEILAILTFGGAIGAAIVDAHGNRSNYITGRFAGGTEDFNSWDPTRSGVSIGGAPIFLIGPGGDRGIVGAPNSIVNITLQGGSSVVSIDVGVVDALGTVVNFLDAEGNVLSRQPLPINDPFRTVSYDAGGGVPVASIQVVVGPEPDGGIQLDNITWSGGLSSPIEDVNQIVGSIGGPYHGSDLDNKFSVLDTSYFDEAEAGINGGAGIDTLTLTGTGQVLDLTAIAGKLESVEIIDITGTGNNTLNLSLGDVLELGESSLFTADETVQMIIKGNAGDVVNLDDLLADGTDPGNWAGQGSVVVEGVTYNVFQHSSLDAQLLVQDGVTTNLV